MIKPDAWRIDYQYAYMGNTDDFRWAFCLFRTKKQAANYKKLIQTNKPYRKKISKPIPLYRKAQ